MRIGHGYDVHRFKEGRQLFLGGIKIDYILGLDGHSDADVCLHAIMDAMLGAMALGDIGRHFSDQDEAFLGIDSKILLQKVTQYMIERKYQVGNLDVTIIAQVPKLAPYIEAMRQCIANIIKAPLDAVNIKATTEEKLGFTGRKEGISCHAVILLESV
jgi:2-C-methyl-D-erythritol 2,4-cyclodiphosphate synthase